MNSRVFNPVFLAPLIHFGLAVALQVQNHFFLALRHGSAGTDASSFFFRLPFLQLENLLISGGLLLVFLVARPFRLLRIASGACWFALGGLLIINQLCYGLTGNHIRPSMTESVGIRWELVLDSILAGASPIFYVELLLWVFVGFFIMFRLWAKESGEPPFRCDSSPWKKLVVLGTALFLAVPFLVVSVQVQKKTINANLERHPLIVLVADLLASAYSETTREGQELDWERPRFGTFTEDAEEARNLQEAVARIRNRPGMPHIIFLPLESIGALQALKEGKPDPEILPNLSRLARTAILFDTIYTSFPSTSRAHVPMITGGTTLTSGSVFHELAQTWFGPTLIGELKKAGYRTGFLASADLDFENLDMLYQKLGFDYFFHSGIASPSFLENNRLNSWGATEESVFALARNWLESVFPLEKPVFIEFLTNATHHPYSVPPTFKKSFPGTTEWQDYQNSILYIDEIIGNFIDVASASGVLNNTLFIFVGDHGEAFGNRHEGNFLHKDFLFEENVRTFIMISDPGRLSGLTLSHRIGTLGDLMPTLLFLLNRPLPEIAGHNLSSPDYRLHNVFFHKLAEPAKWGLRDGSWKFISELGDTRHFELYHLGSDPTELENLADQHATQTAAYDGLCASWYSGIEEKFQANISPARTGTTGTPLSERTAISSETGIFSPNAMNGNESAGASLSLDIGGLDQSGDFVPLKSVNPRQKLVGMIARAASSGSFTFAAEWDPPWEPIVISTYTLDPGWEHLTLTFPGTRPMEIGTWSLWILEGATILQSGTFRVAEDEKIFPME